MDALTKWSATAVAAAKPRLSFRRLALLSLGGLDFGFFDGLFDGCLGRGSFAALFLFFGQGLFGRVIGFGGFVAKYMGDGVLVYFGYPQAHRTTPNGPYGPDCERSRLSVCSDPSNSRYESASPADRWWSAI